MNKNPGLAELVDASVLSTDDKSCKSSSLLPRTITTFYGPYKRKDGRKHFVVFYSDGKRGSLSYPRYLMERHLGRKLLPSETVDHINNDETDDRIENLQILSLADNIRKRHALSPRKMYKFICPMCGKEAEKPENHVKNNLNRGKKGPFCGRSCAGLYGSEIQKIG